MSVLPGGAAEDWLYFNSRTDISDYGLCERVSNLCI